MAWRKSTYSNSGGCVEAMSWRKSTHSGGAGGNGDACVEVGASTSVVNVRDTMEGAHHHRVTLEFATAAWQQFTAGLRSQVS